MHPTAQLICLFASVFLYCFTIGIYAAIIPNFIQEKVCSPDVQADLDSPCKDNSSVLEATDITTTRGMIREGLPVFILLLAGSWRDETGQNKPLLYSALFGEIVGVLVQIIATWKWSVSILTASIIEAILYGFCGGYQLFYAAATCAVTDQSNEDQRTTRLAIYQAVGYAGACVSYALSGYSVHFLGYFWFFVLVIALHLLTIVLVIFSKEGERRLKKDEKAKIFQKMKTITKSRPNNLVVWLMLICCVIFNVCTHAENNLYLYYLQLAYDFTVNEAGLYNGLRLLFSVVSTMILSPVFTNILKWSDFKIGILSSFMCTVSTTSMVFANTLIHLIIYALIDFLKIFVFTMPMSILTKSVNSDELGVFVSIRFIGGCLSPVLLYYIYGVIFDATSNRMPGAFFIASATIALFVFLCFCYCARTYKAPSELPESHSADNTDSEKCTSDKIPENSMHQFIEKPLSAA